MKPILIPLASCAALLGTPVLADTCTFTTECFEAEACADSAFSVAIEQKDGATLLVSDAESFPVSVGGSDAVRIYVGVTESAFHLMSRATDGTARYSTHLYDGPLMVNYLGNCEGAD
ncbi:hypothetical protein SAMN05444273_10117 [Litoreibacter ascidiaceicola]|uniref:Membrane-bound lysozyme-inhibitor of c-type lysozyme n=1 Tax=Litoreibacter ascidiaceicola TaxID=1486859 RepID=A0A1M4SCA5_9RHOB|nr:hypothetical protein [Litoreibacter ascidiaceicola]SHE29831.1 hypothetical protein SAMN05444273_10117 [Litoreibacter ascidiaceicola]